MVYDFAKSCDEMFKKANYYQIFGVSQTATIEEIRKAYHRLAIQYHPDKNSAENSEKMFKEITRIYHILSNPLARKNYDQELAKQSSRDFSVKREVADSDVKIDFKAKPDKDNSGKDNPAIDHPGKDHPGKDKSAAEFYQQGLKKIQKLNYQEAIADYTEALKLNPELVEAYYQRGFAQSQLSNHREAFADYTEALLRNSGIPAIYYYRGLTRFKLANISGAMEDLNQAIALNPDYAEAYYQRGLVYQEIDEKKAAKVDFQQAAKKFLAQGDRFQYRQTVTALANLQKTFTIVDKIPPPFTLLWQLIKTWRSFAFNPVEGLFPAFIALGNRQAIAVSIGFALIFNVCFVLGFVLGMATVLPNIFPFTHLPILTLIIIGFLPVLSLTGASGLMRIICQGNGSFSGDLFISTASLLPLGLWVLWGGLIHNGMAIATLGIFAINYTILTLYSGCREISLMSTNKSVFTVPILLFLCLLPLMLIP
jgi:curved DNA-binding protein CbpA